MATVLKIPVSGRFHSSNVEPTPKNWPTYYILRRLLGRYIYNRVTDLFLTIYRSALRLLPWAATSLYISNNPAAQTAWKGFHRMATLMTGQVAPDDETSPLLGHQRTESHQKLVSNENIQKTGNKAELGKDLVWTLAAVLSAIFLVGLDGMLPNFLLVDRPNSAHATTGTIVATLLSPIGAYFNRSHQSSYLGTSYLLSVCCFTPLYGRLSDIIGRRGAMLLALTLFGSGTFLCGIAPSMNVLFAARAVAGMGGGG